MPCFIFLSFIFPKTNLDQIRQHINTSIVNEKQNTNVRKSKDNEIFTTEENCVVATFQRMPGLIISLV